MWNKAPSGLLSQVDGVNTLHPVSPTECGYKNLVNCMEQLFEDAESK